MQRITAHLHAKKTPPYVVNLDPAVYNVPYPINIGLCVLNTNLLMVHVMCSTLNNTPDIRDTVNYKEVMKKYSLGPNGAIVTSLNLFATRFDQVMNFVEKRAPESK